MARVEHVPWCPRRYVISVDVPGGRLEMHAWTERGAKRVARKLTRMAAEYERWRKPPPMPDGDAFIARYHNPRLISPPKDGTR